MSTKLKEQVDKLFEATKDLQSLEEIKPHCEQFNEWLNTNTNYSVDSLGTVLSRVGFYKKFKSLKLEQGKNADSVPKHDKAGNVVGNELKHYVLLLCGLDKKDWEARNETTRVSDRVTATNEDGSIGIEIKPDEYIEITGKLLESDNPHELAVGLIAATGRRPHEILARGKFTPVDGESYQAMFEGQGKKRGEKPIFKISTLFPASYIIEKLNHLRRDESIKSLLKEVSDEFPRDVAAQNKAIEDRRGNSLRRVVQGQFGGRDSDKPLLNFRHGQDQNDCKALRAACAALVTERDCKGAIGAKMYFAATFLGHITPGEEVSDSNLKHITTTIGYSDYYVTEPVGFPVTPEKERDCNVKASQADWEFVKLLQDGLRLPSQKAATAKLVERYKNSETIAQQLKEAQQEIAGLKAQVKQLEESNNQLQQEKTAMEATTQEPQTITLNITELETWLESKVIEVVGKVAGGVTIPVTAPTKTAAVTPKEEIDWQTKTDAEVWGSKTPGASVEKIRRSYQAICFYNDTMAKGDGNELAITNQALRDLSGCNGLLVRDWINQHKDEVISHNAKYGMENKKDPSNPASYANKGKDTDKILSLVNEEFLSGEGYRKAKAE